MNVEFVKVNACINDDADTPKGTANRECYMDMRRKLYFQFTSISLMTEGGETVVYMKKNIRIFKQSCNVLFLILMQGRSSIIGGGGGVIFIYMCSQTIKTIDFKGN